MGDALAIKEIEPSGTLGYRFVKRLFDLVFSLLMSVLLLIPIAIVCAHQPRIAWQPHVYPRARWQGRKDYQDSQAS